MCVCVWVCVCISQLLSLYFTQLCHSVIPLHPLLGITLPNPSPYSLSLIQTTLIAGCGKSYSIHPSPFTLIPHWILPSHLFHPPLHLLLWDPSVFPFLYHNVYPADYSIMAHCASLLFKEYFFVNDQDCKTNILCFSVNFSKIAVFVFVYIPCVLFCVNPFPTVL